MELDLHKVGNQKGRPLNIYWCQTITTFKTFKNVLHCLMSLLLYLIALLSVINCLAEVEATVQFSGGFATRAEEAAFLEERKNKTTCMTVPQNMVNNTVYVYGDLYQLIKMDEISGLMYIKLWVYYIYEIPELGWDLTEYNIEAINGKKR